MKIYQKGFNYSQDGPGNRLVYHLQGCNMKCIWCSNPEGMLFKGGTEYDIQSILKECIDARKMFFSGGGVTFTGGEATMQYDELFKLLKLLRSKNINTCIETNATHPELLKIAKYIDYLIMDFKHFDNELHKKYTGTDNKTVKENFEKLCKSKRQVHIRIPLINGINTQSPEGFAEYFSEFNTENAVFEFLTYHELGKDKWTEEYKVKDGFVSKGTLNKFEEVFKEYNLKLTRT